MTIDVDSTFHEKYGYVSSTCDPSRFLLYHAQVLTGSRHPAIDHGNPLIGMFGGQARIVSVCPIHVLKVSRINWWDRRIFFLCHLGISLTLGVSYHL
jgi:hypothetical protein